MTLIRHWYLLDGLPNVMMGVMQIQMVAGQDPTVAEGVALLQQCVSGNIASDETIAAYAQKLWCIFSKTVCQQLSHLLHQKLISEWQPSFIMASRCASRSSVYFFLPAALASIMAGFRFQLRERFSEFAIYWLNVFSLSIGWRSLQNQMKRTFHWRLKGNQSFFILYILLEDWLVSDRRGAIYHLVGVWGVSRARLTTGLGV